MGTWGRETSTMTLLVITLRMSSGANGPSIESSPGTSRGGYGAK